MSEINFGIDDRCINEIQVASMHKLIRRAKQAHFTDVRLRINGEYEFHEADWLKHFVELSLPRVRVHPKSDGLLIIAASGKGRYMTWRERIAYWLLGNKTEMFP